MLIDSENRKMILKILGARLSHVRHMAGLSQEIAADLLGMSHTNISRYESGRGNPTLTQLIKFAIVYDIKVIDILFPIDEDLLSVMKKIKKVNM